MISMVTDVFPRDFHGISAADERFGRFHLLIQQGCNLLRKWLKYKGFKQTSSLICWKGMEGDR
jgi:hypothetical protein